MALQKIQGAQRDFSAGELDVSIKRADDNPLMKLGARQMINWRVKNSGSLKNRPGRTALFLETGRVEEVRMSPGNIFYLVFSNGYLRIYNAVGHQVFTSTKKGDGSTNIPWTTATVKNVSFVVAAGTQLSIYIAYGDDVPLNVPQILTWDGVSQTSTWTLTTYAETVTGGGQKRTLFYRMAPPNITMLPAQQTGSGIAVVFSANVLTAGMVNTRMRFVGRQILITTVTNATTAIVTIEESLPGSQDVVFSVDPSATFNIGDEVIGSVSGATGIVTSINSGAKSIIAQLLSTTTTTVSGLGYGQVAAFLPSETVVGPGGGLVVSAIGPITVPAAVSVWDQEIMNIYQGYPTTVFYDQGRLGLCNFPSIRPGIAWSAFGLPTDLYITAIPDSAMFELAPGKSQVLFVVPGMESSEFVFCDNAIYYIPITATNPLKPGSVGFNLLSSQGCLANVKPQPAGQSILYMKAGGAAVSAVQAPGAYYRPYVVDNVSDFHSHLFTASLAVAIAVPNANSQFEELYAYILLANGSIVTGKYSIRQGLLEVGPENKPKIGWMPWNGAGTVSWISAQDSDVIFTTSYAPNGITPISVVEAVDNNQYLDSTIAYNAVPTAFTPPGGKGPLYVFPGPGATVDLMDQTTRMMGTYTIDANGFIIPQNNGGEDLAAATLVAGQTWTATLEPFVADAQPGQALHQRMFKRRVSRMMVYVLNSSGFLFARLFAGPLTPTSPALGATMNTRRITTWNQDDDPTKAPPLRETVERWRPLGRAYDPRVAVIKDIPGPLEILEIGTEASV